MDSYEEYEKKLAEFTAVCEKELNVFKIYLEQQGLAAKTIRNHVSNMNFYLTEYLPYEQIFSVEEGAGWAGVFFSWMQRKMMGLSVTAVKSFASSIKKFYKMVLEEGRITKEDYTDLKDRVKDGVEECVDYLQSDEDDGDFFSLFF